MSLLCPSFFMVLALVRAFVFLRRQDLAYVACHFWPEADGRLVGEHSFALSRGLRS